MTPKRRKTDRDPRELESMVSAWWRRYGPYWHIIIALAFSVIWYQTVNTAVAQTGLNTQAIEILERNFAAMKQEIDDLHGWMAHDSGRSR